MKTQILAGCAVVALLLSVGPISAESAEEATSTGTEVQAEHHDHEHSCDEMHKDGTKCDHEKMEKCEKGMGEGECHKHMKHSKHKPKPKK